MEFVNPEGVELPPSTIPPNDVLNEEKSLEIFKNTSTPKRVSMARPDNGTKGQKIPLLTNHFKVSVNKSDGEKDLLIIGLPHNRLLEFADDGEKGLFTVGPPRNKLEFMVALDDISISSSRNKEEGYFIALELLDEVSASPKGIEAVRKSAKLPQDNECHFIGNLQSNGVEPFPNVSTKMIVKPGPLLDLLMQNQNVKRDFTSQGGQRQGQVQGAMKGGATMAAPRAVQLLQLGSHGGDGRGPRHGRGRKGREHGQRRGRKSPRVDLMKEIYTQEELSYIISFDLYTYSSFVQFVDHIQDVEDVDGYKGVSQIHEIFFVMRQRYGRNRETLKSVDDVMREEWLAVRDCLQCVRALYRPDVHGNVVFQMDGDNYSYCRKQFESLEHLDKCIVELAGNNQDGHVGQERYVMSVGNNGLTFRTRESFKDYEEVEGWLTTVKNLQSVRIR